MIEIDKLLSLFVMGIVSQTTVNGVPIHESTNDLCTTSACNQSALAILHNMDMSVDPCEDFYQFTCGRFLNNTDIPDDETEVNIFSTIEGKIMKQLKESLESPPSEEFKFLEPAQNFYKSCMNTMAIEKRGLGPFHDLLKKLGGWPVVEGEMWNESDFNWIETVYRLRQLGYSLDDFIQFTIGVDFKNSSRKMITIDQVDEEKVPPYSKAYYDWLIDIAVMLGAPRNNATIAELMETIEFGQELMSFILPEEKRQNITMMYNPMTVADLSIRFPSIPWKKYLNNILAPTATINDDEVVNVMVPAYISNIETLISSTSKRTQANYIIWEVITESMVFLPKKISDRWNKFLTEVLGVGKEPQRWQKCVTLTEDHDSVQVLYARKYSNAEVKKKVIEMIKNIKNQLIKSLQMIDWMDDETKKNALDKVRELSVFAAYPDEILDDKKLGEIPMINLMFPEDKFMENYLNFKLFQMDNEIRSLKKPYDKNNWVEHLTTTEVNAYNSLQNVIAISAGMLQGFLYNPLRPKYMNYGAIGSFIGHELIHALDSEGRQFDAHGNLNNWWSSTASEAFQNKAMCIANQYSNYTANGVNTTINGMKTLTENIADNGGFKLAYLAYNNWVRANGDEPELPGLSFNSQQLFWISAANVWCSKIRDQSSFLDMQSSTHSPERFRVNGPLSNIDAFAEDFNCPAGSKMHPKNKCSIY